MSDTSPLPAEAYKVLADVLGGSGKVIAYRPYFAHAFGGACNAILLSQFWFWSNTPTVKTRAGGWFWKSQKEITLETGLTRTETATTRRKLIALGVLREEIRGCPATLHYQIDKNILYEVLWLYILANQEEFTENLQTAGVVQNLQTGLPKTSKMARGKRVNQKHQKPQAITETSSETSTENTIKEYTQKDPPAAGTRIEDFSSSSFHEQSRPEQTLALTSAEEFITSIFANTPKSVPAPVRVTAPAQKPEQLPARLEPVDPEYLKEYQKARKEQTLEYMSHKRKVKSGPADWEALARERMAAKAEKEAGE